MARLPLLSLIALTFIGTFGAPGVCTAQDADGDGIADTEDICPLTPNPEQRGLVKLNGTLPAGGDVAMFSVSDDGIWVVYRSDQVVDEAYELFRVSIEGGVPLRLNPALLPERDVSTFRISPDGNRVVYRADQEIDNWFDVYSVPMAGGMPILLSDTQRTLGGVLISPDSSWVAYIAPDTLFSNPVYFTVPITGGTINEHNTQQPVGEGNAYAGLFSPDSQWLLFLDASGSPSANPRLFRSPPAQSGLQYVSTDVVSPPFAVSPDSARVVFAHGDYYAGLAELCSTPIHVNDAISLNDPADPWPFTRAFAISPVEIDGSHRVALADAFSGLMSIAIDGTDRVILDSAANPAEIRLSPDGGRVVYGHTRLFSVDILGESDPDELSGTMVPGGGVEDFAVSPDGQYVAYRADQDTDGIFELFAVPVAGGDEIKVSGPMIPEGDVESDYAFNPAGDTIVYRADHAIDGIYELFAASIAGGEVLMLNDPLPAGASIHEFALTSDGSRVVYLGEQETAGVDELFSVLLYTDRDADGVYGSCDCDSENELLWTAPEEVSSLSLSHTGGLYGTTTLSWSAVGYTGGETDARYDTLRTDAGNGFHSDSGASISCVETDSDVTISTDDELPSEVFYYVVRAGNACAEGSVGAGRDAGVETVCP